MLGSVDHRIYSANAPTYMKFFFSFKVDSKYGPDETIITISLSGNICSGLDNIWSGQDSLCQVGIYFEKKNLHVFCVDGEPPYVLLILVDISVFIDDSA